MVFDKLYIIHMASRNEDGRGWIQLASYMKFTEEGKELNRRWMKV